MDCLLKQAADPEVVMAYWLNHYASMPNAHFVLAHLMKINPECVEKVLNQMPVRKKRSYN